MRLPVWASLLVGPLVAVAGAASAGAAQPVVAVRVGVLRGVVQDTTRRAGLSYALVTAVGAERRVFANAAGAFGITGLSTGPELIRVQQIGYAAVEVPVVLVDPTTDSTGVERLELVLGQGVYVLPELTVRARGASRDAYYFTIADLARDAFQKAHCVWYVGADSAEGRRVHLVDFEPATHIKPRTGPAV